MRSQVIRQGKVGKGSQDQTWTGWRVSVVSRQTIWRIQGETGRVYIGVNEKQVKQMIESGEVNRSEYGKQEIKARDYKIKA